MIFLDDDLQIPVTRLDMPNTIALQNATLGRILHTIGDKQHVLLSATSVDRFTRNEAHNERFLELQQDRNIWTRFLMTSNQSFRMLNNAQDIAGFVDMSIVGQNAYGQLAT
jgi:hypothetical protein